MRRKVIQLLRQLDAVSVENGITHPGTPDVNCTLGWIELKSTAAWPVRENTIVRLSHDLKPAQRVWLKRRRKAGGSCWVLITIARDWLLFDGAVAADTLGTLTQEQMKEAAIRWWPRTPESEELIECLRPPS